MKIFLFKIYLFYRKIYEHYFSLDRFLIKRVAESVSLSKNKFGDLAKSIYLLSTFRINSPLRENIFQTVMGNVLKPFNESGLILSVIDASDDEYAQKNENFLRSGFRFKIEYLKARLKFQDAQISLREKHVEPYSFMMFEDQVVVGASPNFLRSCCQLLEDFKGLVDIILVEQTKKIKVIKEEKKILCYLNSLEFIYEKQKPLCIVKYNNDEFAILYNYHYGFFCNISVSSTQDYAQRFKTYSKLIENSNHQYYELAGMKRKGPIYKYLAVPLNVCQFNVDCAHTEISLRPSERQEADLFEVLKEGFKIDLIK